MTDSPELPAWLPAAAVAAVAAAFLLVLGDVGLWHPGYAYGDERVAVARLQDLREGAPFLWQFSRGCLTRGLQWAWVGLVGSSLYSLHLPELALVLLEWVCLVALARRWFGEETACWAALALVLCAQTWVRARSLLAFQALPAETLVLALLAGRVRGRTGALLWGLVAALLFLDYDGAFIAVPGVWCACLALEPGFRRAWAASALGLGAGALLLALRQHTDLAAYAAVRLGSGAAGATDPGLAGRWAYLKDLAVGGPALPYFGVTAWPAWAPWAWPGLLFGLWTARRSPALALAGWAVLGVLVSQCVHSAYGPPIHRLAAVVPALALVTGLGFSALRARLGRWGRLLLVLVVLGAGSEGWAWWRHQAAFGPELYDRSEALERVRERYAAQLADPATRVLTQLDGESQSDARFVLDRPPLPGDARPARVLALVPADYAGALAGSGLTADWLWVERGLEPAVVASASGPAAARLAAVEDALLPLVGRDEEEPRVRLARLEAWLDGPAPGGAWVRTAALEADLEEAVQAGGAGPVQIGRLSRTRLVSAAPWMVLARADYRFRPRAALGYCSAALALDPRDGEALLIEAAALRALGDPRAADVGRAWVEARASGTSWRHTR